MRVTLNKTDISVLLQRLAARDEDELYARVMDAWLRRPNRSNVTVEVDGREAVLLRRALPWLAESGAS